MFCAGKLVLEDGSEFTGQWTGETPSVGEVVFNTGMTGYQEVLTDPSYCGQIVIMTYPLIGNYGINSDWLQSRKPFVKGLVVSELCDHPSNWENQGSLADYLREQGIPMLSGTDTRALTRRIREAGAMKGLLVPADCQSNRARDLLHTELSCRQVQQVTSTAPWRLPGSGAKVVVVDYGVKRNILHSLQRQGFDLVIVPAGTAAAEILAFNPRGIFLSNGPGNPTDLPAEIDMVADLLGKVPLFGICLGHQLLALASGADTYKLKFGHRGSNHPVKDLQSGRVHITSQNHGYAVKEASLAGTCLEVTHRAVNDGTVEGLRRTDVAAFSVQYHPEAAPGPEDNVYLFQEFAALMEGYDA